MKIIILVMTFVCTAAAAQLRSFEKQAVNTVQRMLVSRLDEELPGAAFGLWFNQLIGPEAGVIWQLTECGEGSAETNEMERDLNACAEANALLPDGRHIIIAISVGTFKKGISGEPAFYSAVIEQNDQFYQVRRLRDLPSLLRVRGSLPVQLPDISPNLPLLNLFAEPTDLSSFRAGPYPWVETLMVPARPPEKMASSPEPEDSQGFPLPQPPQRVMEGILQGKAMTKAKPVYPANARSLNAFGSVVVQVIVSEEGDVISAKAISGHPVLRGPAVEAALKWIFQPTMLNGVPVRVESVLTFVFNLNSR